MIEKLENTFDGLDPEFHSMVDFKYKINELIEAVNRIDAAHTPAAVSESK